MARIEARLDLRATRQQAFALGSEFALELGDKAERVGCENLLEAGLDRGADLDPGRTQRRHGVLS